MEELEHAQTLPTLTPEIVDMAKTIEAIEAGKPLTQKYRTLQSYQFTDLQHRLLAGVTPDKIDAAKLRDLLEGVKTLKMMEQLIEGRPTEIKGLVAYLIELEKEDVERKELGNVQDAEYVEVRA